jgi:hypothetical protein
MAVTGTSGWIPTERTHPFYFLQIFGGNPIIAATLVYLWDAVLLPQTGLEISTVTVIAVIIGCGIIDYWAWVIFRPAAIRVFPTGIEIRRRFGAIFAIPAGRETLRAISPRGFGGLSYGPSQGFLLSPDQFSAAQRYFRLDTAASPATNPPPR